jgi:hypothetical protein
MTPNISAAFFNTFALAFFVMLAVGVATGWYAVKQLKAAQGETPVKTEADSE